MGSLHLPYPRYSWPPIPTALGAITLMCLCIAGFSLTPYLESFTPTFGLGTPVFPRISSNLHCGTPTFSKRCLWDSYFQNPSENPGIGTPKTIDLPFVPNVKINDFKVSQYLS